MIRVDSQVDADPGAALLREVIAHEHFTVARYLELVEERARQPRPLAVQQAAEGVRMAIGE